MDAWLKAVFEKQEEFEKRKAYDHDMYVRWKNYLASQDAQSFGLKCVDDGIQLVVSHQGRAVFNVRVVDSVTVVTEARPGGQSIEYAEPRHQEAIDHMASLAAARLRHDKAAAKTDAR